MTCVPIFTRRGPRTVGIEYASASADQEAWSNGQPMTSPHDIHKFVARSEDAWRVYIARETFEPGDMMS
jgi:hypothetical protein